MRKALIVLAALSLSGCTGVEVVGGVSAVGGLLYKMFEPREAEAPAFTPEPTGTSEITTPVVARRVVSEIPNIVGVLSRITAGTPVGQVISGVGGFLALGAWLFSRRR